jgi:hypothetical protein
MIAGAVAGTTGAAQLEIRSIVSGLSASELAAITGVTVIGESGGDIEIQTPRYDLFTRILVEIAAKGGSIREIAGNDDIMVSVTERPDQALPGLPGTEIARVDREGFDSTRLLIAVKVRRRIRLPCLPRTWSCGVYFSPRSIAVTRPIVSS